MRILMILLPGNGDGPPLGAAQVIEPFFLLRDSGAEVVIASPDGGAPIAIKDGDAGSPAAQRLEADLRAREDLTETLRVEDIFPEDFHAAICIGATDRGDQGTGGPASALIAQLLTAGAPVAIVSPGHGTATVIAGPASNQAARALLGALASPGAGTASP
jgi:putative intracellular protease/amidase